MFRLLSVIALLAGAALADPIISYADQAGPDDQTLGTTAVRMNELIDVDTNTVVFDAIASALPDLNAAHIRSNGNVLFSVRTNFSFNGNFAVAGDILEWDGTNFSFFLDISTVANASLLQIDAIYEFGDGKLLISAGGSSNDLGGVTGFGWGDLVLYDPTTNTATLFFDGDDQIGGVGVGSNIDAVHILPNGNIVFSVSSDGGVLAFEILQDQNLYEFDPVNKTISVYLDGNGLFNNVTRDLDAVTLAGSSTGGQGIPEPGLLALVCLGAAALVYRRRR